MPIWPVLRAQVLDAVPGVTSAEGASGYGAAMSDLAQVNVSRLLAPLDTPLLADFVDRLADVNAAGEGAPGFPWCLQGEGGDATDVQAFGWDVAGSHGTIVNLTPWTSPRSLVDFVFSPVHLTVMCRWRTWFHRVAEATTALWWVPDVGASSVADAVDERLCPA